MQWRIECKYSGKGHDFGGTLDEAIEDAAQQCRSDVSRWVVWLLPANLRMAEVNATGCLWLKKGLTGPEVQTLMRRYGRTISGLAARMQITQKRIRQARRDGLQGAELMRDWLQSITGEDIGPLPERYRVGSEPSQCGHCGCTLDLGDLAYRYLGQAFCSVACCRRSRGWSVEAVE